MGIRRIGHPGKREKLTPEEAHERMLKRYGLTTEWWNDTLALQENKCAECKQPMPKPVLDAEGKRILCRLCSMAKNQRTKRERDRERKELAAKKAAAEPTLSEFWRNNRNKLSEAEKVEHENRHDDLVLLLEELELTNKAFEQNVPFDEAALRAFIREVCAEVIEFGTVLTDITSVDFFRPEFAEFYEFWTSGKTAYKAQTPYMQYGYLAGLPSHAVHPFLEHVETYLGLPVASCETFATRIERISDVLDYGKVYQHPVRYTRCSAPGCTDTKAYEPSNVSQWFCRAHEQERARKGQESLRRLLEALKPPSDLSFIVKKAEAEANRLFDDQGPYGS